VLQPAIEKLRDVLPALVEDDAEDVTTGVLERRRRRLEHHRAGTLSLDDKNDAIRHSGDREPALPNEDRRHVDHDHIKPRRLRLEPILKCNNRSGSDPSPVQIGDVDNLQRGNGGG
jgi:hypothetical protein